MGTFWEEVQPRFLYVRLETDMVRIRWAFPLWALEESLALALALAPLLALKSKREPARLRLLIPPLLSALFTPREKLLRLPAGEAFIAIQTPGVFIRIGQ